jgi:hypothetical protein
LHRKQVSFKLMKFGTLHGLLLKRETNLLSPACNHGIDRYLKMKLLSSLATSAAETESVDEVE